MKQVFSSQCAIAALVLVFGAFSYTLGQTPSATPDPFITQLTSSGAGGAGAPFLSAATDITANGRFIVFESNGNVATESPNNADGNREIFLADYAQRKIFQLTTTKNVPKATPSPTPTPTPSPSASPTPTPGPTPADPQFVQIEVSNNRPMISFAPTPIVGGPSAGKLVYTIVFSSNAVSPTDPNTDPSATDANQEIWILELAPATNLTEAQIASGAEFSEDLLTGSTFRQLTNTTASRPPTAGALPTSTVPAVAPFVADDNREATISDNGNIIAFISTRSFAGVGAGNADANPELFMAARTGAAWSTFTLVQGTNTQDAVAGPTIISRFQQNPSLSADGSKVAFLSSANLATPGSNDDGNGRGNAEIYLADFNGAAIGNFVQVTRTKTDATSLSVNTLSFGRRLSRDASMIAFTSRAADPKANATTNELFPAIFIYFVGSDTFVRVGSRSLGTPGDVLQFPTFTDYNGTLTPSSVVFASALNFRTDGTFPAAGQESSGLNQDNQPQIFASTISATGGFFSRLTRNPVGGFGGIRPLTTDSRKRLAFSLAGSELGGGNTDLSMEVFYLLIPNVLTESSARLDFFAAASNLPVAAASPSASPTPTPSPSPGVAPGLAPGELSIVRSADPADPLAPADGNAAGGNENTRKPVLPIELNEVSVAVNGAAAGLYFVGNTSAEGIRFVMPIGLAPGIRPVVINNKGRVFRGFINIVAAQPDIFSSTGDAGGTAVVCNVTQPTVPDCLTGTFPLMSSNGTALVSTVIEIHLTGVRSATTSETSVAIGATNIVPSSVRPNTNNFGFDLITLTLPSSLAPGTHTVIVTVTKGGVVTTSRPAATAPTITIVP